MKAYTVMIPIAIDGKERYIKELKVKANSVYEAHLAGVAMIEKMLEDFTYPLNN